MKILQCYDCDKKFQAISREEILNQFYEHYMNDHREIIMNVNEVEKKQWMERFDKDWVETRESSE